MDPALQAAAEINARWVALCLDGRPVKKADWPSDEEIAEIIRKHLHTAGEYE